MLSNNLRGSDKSRYVNRHDDIIKNLQSKCKFAQVVLSLPFVTTKDFGIRYKIEQCHILIKYKYLNHPTVTVCETTGLSMKNTIEKCIRKTCYGWYSFVKLPFVVSKKIFVSNIKFNICKS